MFVALVQKKEIKTVSYRSCSFLASLRKNKQNQRDNYLQNYRLVRKNVSKPYNSDTSKIVFSIRNFK